MDYKGVPNEIDVTTSQVDWCCSILEVLFDEIESDRATRPGYGEQEAGVLMVRRSSTYLDCISAVQYILSTSSDDIHNMVLKAIRGAGE